MKICIVIALTTAVMLIDLIIYADACQPNEWADGCSRVSDLWFTDDCNKHDICYACGYRSGVSRESCDDRWYDNMMNSCSAVNWWGRWFCRLTAWIYYRWVRDWAASSFRVPSQGFCGEGWVPACV